MHVAVQRPIEEPSVPGTLGGKAEKLLELASVGFPVPAFVCSPSELGAAVGFLGLPLAVRSSATAEDGTDVSFAGQFKSFLNLRSAEEVLEATEQCRSSVSEPSVIEYCRRHGIVPQSLRMEVIVQRMVEPELAGVAFTVCPVTGREEVVIEACRGTAEELLAGRRAPLPPNHPLVGKYRGEIERLAKSIQRHYGCPQDIEFAIERGKIYLLQARPITRIEFSKGTGQWTNADFRDGGVSSGVCTPLMWSLYDFIWEDALKGFLRELKLLSHDFQAGKIFFGRPYWNLGELKLCLSKLPGFVERGFDEDLSVAINYRGDGICTPTTLATVLRAVPTLRAIESIWKRQEDFDRKFLSGGFDSLARRYETVPPDVDGGLKDLIHNGYRTTELNYFRTVFCASLAKLDFAASFPSVSCATLMAALPPLRHLEPGRVMREMAIRGETDVTPLLGRFRHHSRRELDIRAPRWDEDREWVEELLRHSSAGAPADPRPAFKRAYDEARRRLPWYRRGSFGRKLGRLRRYVWLREEMRDLSSRMYYIVRTHVLAVAHQRGLGDDIFFMTFQEILDDDRSLIDRNREIYDSYRNFESPHEIGSKFGHIEAPHGGEIRGIGASQGSVTGVARVVRSIEDAARVEQGAILVCPFTDPGWTPVLSRVAAVVTETGGLLSHAAVICREFAIPAVLGVPNATRRISDGAVVTVHGGEGSVAVDRSGALIVGSPKREKHE